MITHKEGIFVIDTKIYISTPGDEKSKEKPFCLNLFIALSYWRANFDAVACFRFLRGSFEDFLLSNTLKRNHVTGIWHNSCFHNQNLLGVESVCSRGFASNKY